MHQLLEVIPVADGASVTTAKQQMPGVGVSAEDKSVV